MLRASVESAEEAMAQTVPASWVVVKESTQVEAPVEEMLSPTTLAMEGSERGAADSLLEGEAQLALLPKQPDASAAGRMHEEMARVVP
jgi:hypothetical protein